MIRRYSSRQPGPGNNSLGRTFLAKALKQARTYDRIAGYFSPSILEVAGEEIEAIKRVRVIANSQVTFGRFSAGGRVSESARKEALWQEWCAEDPSARAMPNNVLERLYHLLDSGQMTVRILPNDRFGLIHGKAGVITYYDDSQTSFVGSANESLQAFQLNYELIWEDDSPEAIAWVQNEFNTLWGAPDAFDLTRDIIDDVLRTAKRRVRTQLEWCANPNPAAPIVESPVYRKHAGLWSHQKYFVQRAFEEHLEHDGARLILADQVGLGKTIQLAMAAQLMALHSPDNRPVLIVVPSTLLGQWQGELWNLLEVPSAYWNNRAWVDEYGVEGERHKDGEIGIAKCPRRIGIVSQGLIFRGSDTVQALLRKKYECVIVDEAHRARARATPGGKRGSGSADANNLLSFIRAVSPRTRSLLLATATPVQMDPVEAWDLLAALAEGRTDVFGGKYSQWWKDPAQAVGAAIEGVPGLNEQEFWNWVRSPLPPEGEKDADGGEPFRAIRDSLAMGPHEYEAKLDDLERLDAPARSRVANLRGTFFLFHNPFIRRIVRRTRLALETTLDPETGRPMLDPVAVRLCGESGRDSLELSSYLQDAYDTAREYCATVAKARRGSGFLETLLLRRIGSSMAAGMSTAQKLQGGTSEEDLSKEYEDSEDEPELPGSLPRLQSEQHQLLSRVIQCLATAAEEGADPKLARIRQILDRGVEGTGPWLERGCIIFTQYFDSAQWLAQELTSAYPELPIGLYAGSNKSSLFFGGYAEPMAREEIKKRVQDQRIQLLIGTDAASEGLNLQVLGSLINMDLPWNPTRLEQRKGRIQRIGQRFSEVYVYNMRYRNSVEDDVHAALSDRLQDIHALFGQIPDTLTDVWVDAALNSIDEARKRIDAVPTKHPFDIRYNRDVGAAGGPRWEACADVLNARERLQSLRDNW
ncbi:MAG: DEAD/DEAH box helicase family protein [Leptospirales bacterium]|nr:DEAD/DEAH box helicase family protein [Leptospirales bacterium]